MKHAEALKIANDVLSALAPACSRIEIAGSVRRGKDDVKDIEIVAVPDLITKPAFIRPEFGKPIPKQYKTKLDEVLAVHQNQFKIKMQKDGSKYKKFFMVDWNISVDLFLVTPPASWGVQYLIRTGPADFSHWMVTQKRYGGALPNTCRVKDGAVWTELEKNTPAKLPMPEEIDFMKLCGLAWIEPGEREAKWAK